MKLHDLKATPGATRARKILGRGPASGQGKTAGKGHKGQKARAGYSSKPGFEGGQMPLQRRLPKRGFNNIFRTEYVTVNVGSLNVFEDGAVVDLQALLDARVISKACDGVKILANGNLTKNLTVKADAFSASAKEKIEAAGGKAEVI